MHDLLKIILPDVLSRQIPVIPDCNIFIKGEAIPREILIND